MTFGARGRQMTAGQSKPSLLVLGQRKRGRLVAFETVAAVAGVEVRRRCKLSCVLVRVALDAAVKFDFEQSVFAFGNMALGAL